MDTGGAWLFVVWEGVIALGANAVLWWLVWRDRDRRITRTWHPDRMRMGED